MGNPRVRGTDERVAQIIATIIGVTGLSSLCYAAIIFVGVLIELVASEEPKITALGVWTGMLAIIIGQLFIWTANKLSPHG